MQRVNAISSGLRTGIERRRAKPGTRAHALNGSGQRSGARTLRDGAERARPKPVHAQQMPYTAAMRELGSVLEGLDGLQLRTRVAMSRGADQRASNATGSGTPSSPRRGPAMRRQTPPSATASSWSENSTAARPRCERLLGAPVWLRASSPTSLSNRGPVRSQALCVGRDRNRRRVTTALDCLAQAPAQSTPGCTSVCPWTIAVAAVGRHPGVGHPATQGRDERTLRICRHADTVIWARRDAGVEGQRGACRLRLSSACKTAASLPSRSDANRLASGRKTGARRACTRKPPAIHQGVLASELSALVPRLRAE